MNFRKFLASLVRVLEQFQNNHLIERSILYKMSYSDNGNLESLQRCRFPPKAIFRVK
jgi:hypothetical protein